MLALGSILILQTNKKQKLFGLVLLLGITTLYLPAQIKAEEQEEYATIVGDTIRLAVPEAPDDTYEYIGFTYNLYVAY